MSESDLNLLVRYRLDQAQEALQDARLLHGAGRSSLSVVNRSYYAMFYAVLALLQRISKVPCKHAEAISLFDGEYVKKGIFTREDSKDLHRIFDLRQVSDYQVIEPVTREETIEALAKADRFVKVVTAYLSAAGT